jgi:Kef-type K+ transport system membrane component KefB
MNSPVNVQMEHVLLVVILQLIIIIAAARLFGLIFRHLGQPQVCGEIAAGLILGPSFFGRFFPNVFVHVFQPSQGLVFSTLSQIGLILLMFLIGLEFDFSHLRTHGHIALSISLAGIILPFGLGLGIAQLLHPFIAQNIDRLGFSLFIATALSITALPVLGRMLTEFNIARTRLGSLTITAAAVDDASGWIILALVTAIVRARFSPLMTLAMIAEALGYALFVIFVARPILCRWTARMLRRSGGELSVSALATLLVIIFLSATITNLIGLFSIFGAFIVGAILYDQHDFREAVSRRLRDFVTVFFLPIFFTYTGLRTDVGTMHGRLMWALCGLLVLTAIAGKIGGCTAAALLNGVTRKEAWSIGVLMNTRGLMELIVINLGHDMGVIPTSVFFMLVVMAVVTTYMTSPLMRRLVRNTELEPYFEQSSFMQRDRNRRHSLSGPA